MQTKTDRIKVEYLLSHPIYYYSPVLKRLAQSNELELHVIYATDAGAQNYYDQDFSKDITWDTSLLDGYNSSVLFPGRDLQKGFLGTRAPGLWNMLDMRKPDVIITHGWGNIFYAEATIFALAKKIPLIYRSEVNAFYDPGAYRPGKNHMLSKELKPFILFPLLRNVDGLLAIGTLNREYYLNAGVQSERIYWAPFSIEDSVLKKLVPSPGDRDEKEKELGLKKNSFRILFCGKLIERKRPLDIVNAVAMMPDNKNVEIIFAGDGELIREAKDLAKEKNVNAHFPGFINRDEIPLFYSLAHVLALPSENETWGLVVNEAMSMGLPAIVSDKTGCAPDLVLNGETGYVCPVGDVKAIAARLAELSGSGEIRTRLKKAALDKISEFNIDRTIQGYLEAIKEVHQKRNPGAGGKREEGA